VRIVTVGAAGTGRFWLEPAIKAYSSAFVTHRRKAVGWVISAHLSRSHVRPDSILI
jgi:hypothetical protein